MTALQVVYALSLAGAVIFFLAGWIARASRRAAPEPQPERAQAPLPASRTADREKLEQAESEAQRLGFALLEAEKREREAAEQVRAQAEKSAGLASDKDRLHQEAQRLEAELLRERERAYVLEREAETLRKSRLATSPNDAELQKERLRREAAERALDEANRARTLSDKSRADAEKARADAIREREKQSHERDEVQQRLTRETDDRKRREQEAAEARAALDKLRTETTAQLERLRAEKQDVEHRLSEESKRDAGAEPARRDLAAAREEASGLRARLAALEADIEQVAETRYENQELQVRLETASSYVLRSKREIAELKTELEAARKQLESAAANAERLHELERQQAEAARPERDSGLDKHVGEAMAQAQELRSKVQALEGQAREAEGLREENRALREEQRRVSGAQGDLDKALADARELRLKVQAIETRAAQADRLLEENSKLRDELSDLEDLREASLELDNVRSEWKHARVQVESLTRRVAELEQLRMEQLVLAARVQELALAEQDAARARERVRFLEAMLYTAGMDADDRPPSSKQIDAGTTMGSFEACLEGLVRKAPTRSVALADNGGLLVAGAGDATPHEAMAAVSGLASDLALRAVGLLPFSEVEAVQLRDSNQLVFTCRLFQNEEGRFAVAALGRGAPALEDIERTVTLVGHVMFATSPAGREAEEQAAADGPDVNSGH